MPAKTVLFVDDEPSLLAVRKLIFEGLGYTVLTAESGSEAVSVVQTKTVDAVVLDYLMPGMDGAETARRLRHHQSHVPIILSSASLTLPDELLNVVDVCVSKAEHPEVLITTVRRQIELADMVPARSVTGVG